MIPYLQGGERPTAVQMNALFAALDTKLTTLLGGRSFILGMVNAPANGSLVIPAPVFGKTFFFVTGPTAYAQFVPGRILKTVSAVDPVTSLTVSADSVRPYDHEPFEDAIAAAVVSSYDGTKRVATIPTIGGAYYTDGLTATAGVGLCEHSLQAHTVEHDSQTYFVKEAAAPIPEKRYDWAQAEIIIEGRATVDLPVTWDKYRFFRFHNLQPIECEVTFGAEFTVTLEPFGIACVRRDGPESNYRLSDHKYFQTFEAGDPRFFWYWPSIPSNTVGSTMNTTVLTASGGMQGNNVVNPAVLHDFVSWFVQAKGDAAGAGRYWAWFNQDVHELCDIGPDHAEVFGAASGSTPVGDLFHHKGWLKVLKVHKTVDDPLYPGIKQIYYEDLQFNGYGTIVADFAARDITVAADGSGNLAFSASAALPWTIDVVPLSTNLLKGLNHALGVVDPEFYTSYSMFGRPLGSSAFTFAEVKVFESGNTVTHPQDHEGRSTFTLNERSTYRIRQRVFNSAANDKSYVDSSGVTVNVVGPETESLSEAALGTAGAMVGIHTVPVSDLLSLKYFGNPALSDQSDDYVSYEDAALTLTPEGWVLTFRSGCRRISRRRWALGRRGTRISRGGSSR
jgi:hypothetical protein